MFHVEHFRVETPSAPGSDTRPKPYLASDYRNIPFVLTLKAIPDLAAQCGTG